MYYYILKKFVSFELYIQLEFINNKYDNIGNNQVIIR